MFQIRKHHLESFKNSALRDFGDRGVRHLRHFFRQETATSSDSQLRRHIADCIARAAQYGLTTERQLMCFVDATYLIGERFDSARENGWARSLLGNPALGGDAKAAMLIAAAQIEARRRDRAGLVVPTPKKDAEVAE